MKRIFVVLLVGALGVFVGRTVLANDQGPTTNDAVKETPVTHTDVPGFFVIGIEARTTNAKEATADGVIPRQWQRFFQEGTLDKIPNKIDGRIYAVYTDYASDHNGEYDFVIGARVKPGTVPPPGMVLKAVSGGSFAVFTSEKGPLPEVIPQAWRKILMLEDEKKFARTYKADFEVYDERSQNPQNSQIDIYIGIK